MTHDKQREDLYKLKTTPEHTNDIEERPGGIQIKKFTRSKNSYRVSYKSNRHTKKNDQGKSNEFSECDFHLNYRLEEDIESAVECIRKVLKTRRYFRVHFYLKHLATDELLDRLVKDVLENLFYYKRTKGKDRSGFAVERVRLGFK